MKGFSSAFSGTIALGFLAQFLGTASAAHSNTARAISLRSFSRAHSLGESYQFEARDGWLAVNTTDLTYKYKRAVDELDLGLAKREENKKKGKSKSKKNSWNKAISSATGSLSTVFEGLKGIGKIQTAIITWYTGVDLLHPSCWPNIDWAPTASYALRAIVFAI
ncbi:hypothetical protein HGRIS_009756 [Hohenbuehelia grisea]|uniref:Uncharacterized protein n=1 Tax=Hohenbuehelia grisea TaxID=104357 RepID=A0ABR3J254_9AGAR